MTYNEFRFAFHARDFDRSVNFYVHILGLKHCGGWDRPDGKGALLAVDDAAHAVIEIYGAADGTTYDGPGPAAGINLALRLASVAAVDDYYSRLADQAGTADYILGEAPADHHWGHRSFVITDPDGIAVHIYAEIK